MAGHQAENELDIKSLAEISASLEDNNGTV